MRQIVINYAINRVVNSKQTGTKDLKLTNSGKSSDGKFLFMF